MGVGFVFVRLYRSLEWVLVLCLLGYKGALIGCCFLYLLGCEGALLVFVFVRL